MWDGVARRWVSIEVWCEDVGCGTREGVSKCLSHSQRQIEPLTPAHNPMTLSICMNSRVSVRWRDIQIFYRVVRVRIEIQRKLPKPCSDVPDSQCFSVLRPPLVSFHATSL
jgi:hypothetical protein